MKKTLLTLGLSFGLVLGGCTTQEQKEENVEQFEKVEGHIITVKASKGEDLLTDVEIFIREERSLMEVMQEFYEIETAYDGQFIVSINGVKPEDINKEGWMIYINGEMAMVGANDLILKDGDKVEFKYESFQ